MSDGASYCFTNPAQWDLCLTIAVPERGDLRAGDGVVIATWPGPVTGFAVGVDGSLLWIGADGVLHAGGRCAGPRFGHVRRLVPGRRVTWVLSDAGLERIDAATLQRLGDADLSDADDIAADGRAGIWAITGEGLYHLAADGSVLAGPKSVASGDRIAAHGRAIALLTRADNRVRLLANEGPALSIGLGTILGRNAPAFVAHGLFPAPAGFLLDGAWDGAAGFLLLDDAGEPLRWGVWEGTPPVAIACAGGDILALFATDTVGTLLRFVGGGNAAGAGGRKWLTPVLESDTLAGKWLRADLRVLLPEGATLALRWAASGDPSLRITAATLAADTTRLRGDRIRAIDGLLEWSAARTFIGEARPGDPVIEDLSFPLTEATGNLLWVELTLDANGIAGQSAIAPLLASLAVLHDAPGLIDYLPGVFAGQDGDQDGTLARLLGVFEAVSQGIDAKIGTLADRLDPTRTEARWLPDLGALLGLPFDATLPEAAQRGIIVAAPALLAGRGTRRGILTLLAAVLGDRPYRVIDRSEEFAAVTLGGSRLPGFLTGPSIRTPKLSARLVLGRTPLCPPDASRLEQVARAPELLVEIPASGRERADMGAALERMVGAMVPAGVLLHIRWIAPGSGAGGDLLATVDTARPLALGDPRPLGAISLGGDRNLKLRDGGMPIAGAMS